MRILIASTAATIAAATAVAVVHGPARATATATTSVGVDTALIVSLAARDSETARLRAFGVHVPDGGVVLERPWDPPYSRRSFVVPQAWFHAPRTDSVSADALLKDLPILHALMERAYGGWGMAKHRGWDWDAWFARWNTMLEAHRATNLRLADAFAPMKDFMAFQLDNHTTIPLGLRFGSGSRTSVIEGVPPSPCTGLRMADGHEVALDPKDPSQRPRLRVRWNAAASRLDRAAYISFPSNRGMPASIHCGDAWLTTTAVWPSDRTAARDTVIRALSGAATDEPDFRILEPTIAYLRLPTFSVRNNQLIEQRLPHWPKPTGAERVLIVDLRDNDGGNATLEPLAAWVQVPDAERAVHAHRHEGASCLYHALRWGYTTISTIGIKPPVSRELTHQLQLSIDDLFKPSPSACPSQFKDSNSGLDYRKHTMRPPGRVGRHARLLVLVNDGCGSDCEAELAMLATVPGTVVVGSNTFGVAQFIQPGYSVLPHTRLPFRIALGTSDNYGDNRSFDGFGFDVDILLESQVDQSAASILALAHFIGGA